MFNTKNTGFKPKCHGTSLKQTVKLSPAEKRSQKRERETELQRAINNARNGNIELENKTAENINNFFIKLALSEEEAAAGQGYSGGTALKGKKAPSFDTEWTQTEQSKQDAAAAERARNTAPEKSKAVTQNLTQIAGKVFNAMVQARNNVKFQAPIYNNIIKYQSVIKNLMQGKGLENLDETEQSQVSETLNLIIPVLEKFNAGETQDVAELTQLNQNLLKAIKTLNKADSTPATQQSAAPAETTPLASANTRNQAQAPGALEQAGQWVGRQVSRPGQMVRNFSRGFQQGRGRASTAGSQRPILTAKSGIPKDD